MLPFANYHISSPTMRDQNENNNKRRKKRRPATLAGGGGDDLAVVKAAAWAWYQRNEGKPMVREFDLTRATSRNIPPRPTRYKLEATKNMILSENRILAEHRVSNSSLWYDDCNDNNDKTLRSRLLDTYEIDSISKRIDDLLPEYSFPVSPTSSVFRHDHYHDYTNSNDDDDHGSLERKTSYDRHSYDNNGNVRGFVKKVSNRKLWGRFMLLGPSRVCGQSEDVDLRAMRPSRRSGKVAVASAATATTVALVKAAARGK